jgi:hypothetical protein
MKEINIRLLSPSKFGRLYYQPDLEIEPFVIFCQNNLKITRKYSINIDSAIILDINEDKILQGAEFIIHKNVWVVDRTLTIPHPEIDADIQIINLTDHNSLIETPIRSITDEKYKFVYFGWGVGKNDVKWICLSEKCYASVSGILLTGFFITLS